MSFAEIAGQARGRPLLGYLKADVDQLGMLFAQGLRRDGDSYDTAAHIAALSRELDLFFSGWVQHLLSRTPDYRAFYTIFSGGDDLFLVGPWDKAAPLAIELRAQFGRFAGRNPDLSLSAGIVCTKERYPIARAATDAEEMLERAKEHVWYDAQGQARTRDQLAVLGETLRWDVAPQVFTQIATLQERSALLTSAFLYDLIEYGRLYRLWHEEQKVEGLRYKALFAYSIARNLRKGDVEIYRWADELMRSLHGAPESLTMRYLGLIATYVLFVRRSG